jgi:16S rRNA processing protein RimM
MDEELIFIGRIIKPQGIKGELKVLPLSDNYQLFDLLKDICIIQEDSSPILYSIQQARKHKNFILLKLAGCDTIATAQEKVGAMLGIPKSKLPSLPADKYYQFEIIGLKVYTAKGEYLGEIKQILSTGSNDVYVVRDKMREFLIPAIKQAIQNIDKEQGRMILSNMEGLIDPHAL